MERVLSGFACLCSFALKQFSSCRSAVVQFRGGAVLRCAVRGWQHTNPDRIASDVCGSEMKTECDQVSASGVRDCDRL